MLRSNLFIKTNYFSFLEESLVNSKMFFDQPNYQNLMIKPEEKVWTKTLLMIKLEM